MLLGAALWGAAGPIAQWLNQQYAMTALQIAFLRLALPLPLLLVAARRFEGNWPWQGLRQPDGHHLRRLAAPLLGAGLGLGGFQILFFTGVAHVGGGPATLIAICLCPLTTAILARLWLGEQLNALRLAAIAIAIPGVALLIATPPGQPPGDALFGGLMAAMASLAFAVLAVSSRAIQDRVPPLATVSLAFALGALLLLPTLLESLPLDRLSGGGFALMAFMAIGPTGIGYILFFRGARRVAATATGVLVLAEPAAASALAWLVFGDRFTLPSALGALLLALAVFMTSRSARPPAPARRASSPHNYR